MMKTMALNEQLYNEIKNDLIERLGDLTKIMVLTIPEYKDFFTKTGTWDKRKKYFDFNLKIYKSSSKTDNLLRDMGKIFTVLGDFVEDNNNERVYMLTEFDGGRYNDEFRIKLKFISYDMAAKILLSQ